MSEREFQITSIEELKKIAMGELLELPPFVEGTEFIVRVKKPSLMALAKSGRIPNALLASAQELFNNAQKGKANNADPQQLGKMYDLCVAMAKAALVEPTYDELEKAGIELTDSQLLTIFNYTQTGAKQIDSFRKKP